MQAYRLRSSLAALLFFIGLPGSGQESVSLLSLRGSSPAAVPVPWELKVKTGLPDYRTESVSGTLAFCMRSRSSSFSIQRKVEVSPERFTQLTWKWLASELPLRGDLRQGNLDDQAAQLFVLFEGRKAISYVWDSNAPRGTITTTSIPFIVTIKIMVIESGAANLNSWKTYKRDINKDYERLFGDTVQRVKAVRFQINSQYTQSTAKACIAEISLTSG